MRVSLLPGLLLAVAAASPAVAQTAALPTPEQEEKRARLDKLRQEALQAKLEGLRSGATIERPEAAVPPTAIRETDLVN